MGKIGKHNHLYAVYSVFLNNANIEFYSPYFIVHYKEKRFANMSFYLKDSWLLRQILNAGHEGKMVNQLFKLLYLKRFGLIKIDFSDDAACVYGDNGVIKTYYPYAIFDKKQILSFPIIDLLRYENE